MDLIRRNFALKVAALLTAIILWFTFNYLSAAPTYNKSLDLPLALRNVGGGMVATSGVHMVTVELSAPRPTLEGLTPESFNAFVDCAGKGPGTFALNVAIVGSSTDKIRTITPSQVVVVLDRYAYRRVPVVAGPSGAAAGTDIEPKTVMVAGGATKLSSVFAAEVSVDSNAPKKVALAVKPVPVDAHFVPIGGLSVAPSEVRVTMAAGKGR